MIKKAAVVVVSGLILIAAFSYLIYPTPYRYIPYGTSTIRVNVFTGKTEHYMKTYGWVDTTTGVTVQELQNQDNQQ